MVKLSGDYHHTSKYEQYRRDQFPSNPEIRPYMDELRDEFSAITLFALAVCKEKSEYDRVRRFVEHASESSGKYGLFLIPNEFDLSPELQMFTHFPAVAKVAEIDKWPGVVFWTRNGSCTFANIDKAEELFHQVKPLLPFDSRAVGETIRQFDSASEKKKKLLHLSDLHFGHARSAKTEALLLSYVTGIVRAENISRIVITGDLFHQPLEAHATAFRSFYNSLTLLTGKEPIIVPGNHDRKLFGNFRWSLQQLADLQWSNIVVDDTLEMIFLCFDSSRNAKYARGRVDSDYLLSLGTALQTKLANNQELKRYLKVSLVHHHPFSFSVDSLENSKLLELFGKSLEDFLLMEDAGQFIQWCALRGSPLILHGHKHVPFHAVGEVFLENDSIKVNSVGCGSSTGIDGPLSINIITCDGTRWSTRFLIDRGDASGLNEHSLQIRSYSA